MESSDLQRKLETLLSDTDRQVNLGWRGLTRVQPQSNGTTFKKLFDSIDADGNGGISHSELEAVVAQVPQVALASSAQLQQLRQRLAAHPEQKVSAGDFEAVGEDLFRGRLERLCGGAGFAGRLADELFGALVEGQQAAWRREAESLHPLKALAELEPAARARLLLTHLLGILPALVAELALAVGAEQEYEKQEQDPEGKFNTAMVLCDPAVFSLGLEKLVGFPEYESESKVLGAVWAEHAEGAHAEVAFTAWNHGKERQTTPKANVELVLPQGPAGDVYGLDYAGKQLMCEDFLQHPMAIKAKLKKSEIVALRLYTGPMFQQYNSYLRELGKRIEGEMAAGAADAAAAVLKAREQQGPFPYPTTVHVINSALVKVSRVTAIPAGGKVFRGLAGVLASEKFTQPNAVGARVGGELGFISTSSDKDQAVGYLGKHKPHRQIFEISVAYVDRGADIDWLSLFPGEKEMLFPPNSCLEVAGPMRHEFSDTGLVIVFPLRINVNLKGRTIEDFQGMRKELLVEAASNALHEVEYLVDGQPNRPEVQQRAQRDPHGIDNMLASIKRECREEVQAMKDRPQEHYNDDGRYQLAYAELTELRALAEGKVDLWLCDGVESPHFGGVGCADDAAWIPLKTAKLQRMRHTMKELEKARAGGRTGEVRRLALKLCAIQRLFAHHLEERGAEGFTPLLRWAHQGWPQAVEWLVDAGADCARCAADMHTPLHLAVCAKHTGVVRALLAAESPPLDALDARGDTAVLLATKQNYPAGLRLLLEKRPDTEVRDSQGWTALLLACFHDDTREEAAAGDHTQEEVAGLLIQFSADVLAKTPEGKTTLMLACSAGMTDTARMLVEKGAEINATTADGWTALMMACAGGNEAVATLLVEHGASVDAGDGYVSMEGGLWPGKYTWKNRAGRSWTLQTTDKKEVLAVGKDCPYYFSQKTVAVEMEGSGAVRAILGCGGEAYLRERSQPRGARWPLAGHYECHLYDGGGKNGYHYVTIAEEAPGRFTWSNRAGVSWSLTATGDPLVLAVGSDCPYHATHKTLPFIVKDGRIESLRGPGNEPYVKEGSGEGAEEVASVAERVEQATLERGEERDAVVGTYECHLYDNGGKNDYHYVEVTENNRGWTALMLASFCGHEGIVGMLIEKGADVKAQDSQGWTALSLAAESGRASVQALLQANGAA